METTTRDERPAGTASSGPPAGRPVWHDAAIIAGTSAVLAFVSYVFWQDATTCDEGFACIGADLFAAAFSAVVVPTAAWILWRLCRIPRAFLLAAATTAIGHVLADVVGGIQKIGHGFSSETPLASAPVYIIVGIVSGLAAALLAGKGTWSRWVRVLVVLLVALASFAVHARYEHLYMQHRENDLRAVGVTMYLPNISDRATPSHASSWSDDAIHISYHYDPPPGGKYDFPYVILLAATDDGCSDADAAGYYASFPESVCREMGGGFVADDGINHYVGVTRGDTVLVLEADEFVFDDEEIAELLRHAPQVSAAEMARL